MDRKDVEKVGKKYITQLLGIVVVLYVGCGVLMLLETVNDIMLPATVGGIFLMIAGLITILAWRKVMIVNQESLPTFFTAVSGFRMLAALLTLFGCYIIVGRENMGIYVIVFMAFYFAALVHHSLFFARINNKN